MKENNSEESKEISPDSWHSVRAEIANQYVKSLLAINGGGAVALLAFLQKIWKDNPGLSEYVLISLGLLCFGLVVGVASNFLRVTTSLEYDKQSDCKKIWRNISYAAQVLSLLFFFIAMAFLIIGAWSLLPRDEC
tara:strand:- start:192 stop:596 length:405 start_codon:yes stop_codon:yes gene_type:complete